MEEMGMGARTKVELQLPAITHQDLNQLRAAVSSDGQSFLPCGLQHRSGKEHPALLRA